MCGGFIIITELARTLMVSSALAVCVCTCACVCVCVAGYSPAAENAVFGRAEGAHTAHTPEWRAWAMCA